jgi:hypothetical protein
MQKERTGYKHQIFIRMVIYNQRKSLSVGEEKHSVGEAHNDGSFLSGAGCFNPCRFGVAPTLPIQRRSLGYDPNSITTSVTLWNEILQTFDMRDS